MRSYQDSRLLRKAGPDTCDVADGGAFKACVFGGPKGGDSGQAAATESAEQGALESKSRVAAMPSQNVTVNLINRLVERGVLTKRDSAELLLAGGRGGRRGGPSPGGDDPGGHRHGGGGAGEIAGDRGADGSAQTGDGRRGGGGRARVIRTGAKPYAGSQGCRRGFG